MAKRDSTDKNSTRKVAGKVLSDFVESCIGICYLIGGLSAAVRIIDAWNVLRESPLTVFPPKPAHTPVIYSSFGKRGLSIGAESRVKIS